MSLTSSRRSSSSEVMLLACAADSPPPAPSAAARPADAGRLTAALAPPPAVASPAALRAVAAEPGSAGAAAAKGVTIPLGSCWPGRPARSRAAEAHVLNSEAARRQLEDALLARTACPWHALHAASKRAHPPSALGGMPWLDAAREGSAGGPRGWLACGAGAAQG